MPTEHRELDIDAELRAFAVALEAHTAEPIRPGPRPVDDGGPDPVVVEPTPLRRPERRWLLPAIAATVVALALVGGLVVLTDGSIPSDTPTSTTTPPTAPPPPTTAPDDADRAPSAADAAVIATFVAAYDAGDTDEVLALLADDVVVSERYGGAAPSPTDEPLPAPDRQLAWKLAQGEIITEPECFVAPNQPAEGSSIFCEYTTLDAFVQAVDGTPIPTRALFTIVDGEITGLHQGYGNPDYSILAIQFRQWIERNHPDMFEALFGDWTTRGEAEEQGRLRARWAQDWAKSLDDDDDESATATPRPASLAPALAAPVDGATQPSIVGDITWTRVEGDAATGPTQVVFELDGVLYGTRLGFVVEGAEGQPQWWRSTDGVTWDPWTDAPEDTWLAAMGDTLWAEGPELRIWNGAEFEPIQLPPVDPPGGEGLELDHVTHTIAAELDGEIVVASWEEFGVPWEEALGSDEPLTAVPTDGPGEFPRVWICTGERDAFGGRGCDGSGDNWIVRMDVFGDDPPHQIDYYDTTTGELIATVLEPADGPVTDDGIHWVRTGHLIVDGDGTDARRVDWPFDWARFAEHDGRLFALTHDWTASGRAQLWVTDDLDRWELLELPNGIVDAFSLSSDGARMIVAESDLHDDDEFVTNRPMWITTDGVTWEARESALTGYWTEWPSHAEFGWIQAHDGRAGDAMNPSPSIAVSADAETWQIVPIPLPAALSDRALTWADANSDDGTIGWEWGVVARGDTIFVFLRSNTGDLAQEHWVGRVAPG